jgi:hypothetical protein
MGEQINIGKNACQIFCFFRSDLFTRLPGIPSVLHPAFWISAGECKARFPNAPHYQII